MGTSKSTSGHRSGGDDHERARHRVDILRTLVATCRKLQRVQDSAAARGACRDVAGMLSAAVAREEAAVVAEKSRRYPWRES